MFTTCRSYKSLKRGHLRDNSSILIGGAVAIVGVIGAGIWMGLLLRRKHLSTYRDPYLSRRFRRGAYPDSGEYEAVGI